MTGGRISVREAAQLMGISPNQLRYWMDTGAVPIGHVLPSRTGKTKQYIIYRAQVEEWMGGKRGA